SKDFSIEERNFMNVTLLTTIEKNRILSSGEASSSIWKDIPLNGTSLKAVVIRSFLDQTYLIRIAGREIRINSEAKLFEGERLELKATKESNRLELEILNRSFGENEIADEIQKKAWSTRFKNPTEMIRNTLDTTKFDLSTHRIFQILNAYFPGVHWRSETNYFEWKLEDGEGSAYFDKNKNGNGFYLHLTLNFLGNIDTYLNWKEEDLSDLSIHILFDKLESYRIAYEKLGILKKMLSSNSIPVNHIIFHYSTMDQVKGDWRV
ncbi:MAG TPA: hypothetical protein PLF66_23335, partial [Leptospiraceae bacterium]|nr:hypothetical protein [Leptospiraceae bacterium]